MGFPGTFFANGLGRQGEFRTFLVATAKWPRLNRLELCGFWGSKYAILARLHRSVHQSAMRSPRPLASRRCHRSPRRRRPLPLLRRLPAQRPPASRPALPHAPPLPNRPPPAPSPPALRQIHLRILVAKQKSRKQAPPAFLLDFA